MKEHNKQIVQNFLKLMSVRDLEGLMLLFSEKVDWYIPGDNIKAEWLGRRNTIQEIRNFYETLWKNTEPVSAQVDHILVEDNVAVITGGLHTNRIIDSPFSIQMTIEDGLIKKYRLLEDSHAVSKALD